MYSWLQGLFQSVAGGYTVTNRRPRSRSQDQGGDALIIFINKKKKGHNEVFIPKETEVPKKEEKKPVAKTPTPSTSKSHASECNCPNCDEVFSQFAECHICCEPLQCSGPCACPSCGGLWCTRCSNRISRCAWCRAKLPKRSTTCVVLKRVVDKMKLPCRNHARGCTELLTADIRESHEEDCDYAVIKCPVNAECGSVKFEELSEHLMAEHELQSMYSQKITIHLDNVQSKIKSSGSWRNKYILLHDKSAFMIKICIKKNDNMEVDIMRRKLDYGSEVKYFQMRKSDYCALMEFRQNGMCLRSAILIENEIAPYDSNFMS